MESQQTKPIKVDLDEQPNPQQPLPSFHFYNHFQGTMIMYSDRETVQQYLNAHQGWFVRCAKPMKAQPIGENSYALTIGRFGALGFELEPKLGVELLPEAEGVYRMETVEIERSDAHFYEVEYKAALQLVEKTKADVSSVPITAVDWTLELSVSVHFPRFIHRFSTRMIQKTGDRILTQIVRQVSRRLTKKVQTDFHTRYNLPIPS